MPAIAANRPVVPPLSLVTAKGKWYDAALLEGPTLIDGEAPAFDLDWKYADGQPVRQAFGWADLPRERRTRTAIDAAKGRAADQQLFSYGLVVPKTPKAEFVWETCIGLHGIPATDRNDVRRELANLFACGLPNIGKTRAVAAVTWLQQPTTAAVGIVPATTGIHVVTLQTEFLMTNPDTLLAAHKSLFDAYAEFWNEASGGHLELVRFFARQAFHGGFLSRRYGKPGGYEPYLLTNRGSTFVLRAIDANAATTMTNWKQNGLPLPAWPQTRYAQNGKYLWQTCPFLPENGFGEVAIDLACHSGNKP